MPKNRISDIETEQIDQMILKGYDLLGLDLESAKDYAKTASVDALAINYSKGLSGSLILRGACEGSLGEYASAIQHIQKGMDIARENHSPDLLTKGFSALGNINYKLGNLEEALAAYQHGLEQTRLGSGDYEIILLNNTSVIYSKINQLDQSLKILLETMSLAEKGTEFYGFICANIAEVYYKMDDFPKAERYMLTAEEVLAKSTFNAQYHIQLYKIKGKIASYQKKEEQALLSLEAAVQLCEQLGDKYRLCNIGIEIGRHYMTTSKYELALESLKRAKLIGDSISADVELRDIAMLMADCFESLLDFKAALTETKRYHALYQKINTKSLENQLLIKTVTFEVEQAKKDAEIQRIINEEVNLIGQIGQKITATLDINLVLRLIYKHIQSIVEVDAFGVCTVNAHHQTIEFKMMIENGKKQPLHHVSLSDPSSLAARCIRDRKMLHLQDLSQSDTQNITKGKSMHSVIFFPLVVSDEIVGALTFQSLRANAYSDNALRLVESLGAYIGIAIKNSMQSADLAKKTLALERLSQTDVLTCLYNRRYMMTRLDALWSQWQRTGQTFYIAILDVDHFKRINDENGHHVGDTVLIKISKLMCRKLRKYDVVGRWGGEEFIMILPESDEAIAHMACERLRQSIEALRIMHDSKRIPVTATIGLAKATPHDDNIDAVIQRADHAMYEGKDRGRNCVCMK